VAGEGGHPLALRASGVGTATVVRAVPQAGSSGGDGAARPVTLAPGGSPVRATNGGISETAVACTRRSSGAVGYARRGTVGP
jgi:hypothetical protein